LVRGEARDLLAFFTRRVRHPEDAADLLANTLLVLWRRVQGIPKDDTQARMWMYGVANRVLSEHRRGTVRRSVLSDRLRHELAHDHGAPDLEAALDVRAALERLDPFDAEIIRLVHWEGFTQAEVAAILGRRPGTIRSRYHRARTQLKGFLADAVDPQPSPGAAHTGQDESYRVEPRG
jgi:RNA polymerase sigma-70 factor (ECF subfamily)